MFDVWQINRNLFALTTCKFIYDLKETYLKNCELNRSSSSRVMFKIKRTINDFQRKGFSPGNQFLLITITNRRNW